MQPNDPNKYCSITRHCFINAPFERLEKDLLETFLRFKLQPEIGLEGECLWNRKEKDFIAIARRFEEHGLPCTLHAPFTDLTPGGGENKIRELTRDKLRRAFQLLKIFKPKSIVCHLGYEDHKHSYKLKEWLGHSVATWTELLDIAAEQDTSVMFENTYEKSPDIHLDFFEHLPRSNFGFCLDVGHVMAFSGSTWQQWLEKLAPWLGQLHLHDNDGDRDTHIAIGRGRFDFKGLFSSLAQKDISPLITLEPHSEKDLWLSLDAIMDLKLFGDNP